MKKTILLLLKILAILPIVLFVVFSKTEDKGVNLCAEARLINEDAWRDCVDYYVNQGLTLDEIIGKEPLVSRNND